MIIVRIWSVNPQRSHAQPRRTCSAHRLLFCQRQPGALTRDLVWSQRLCWLRRFFSCSRQFSAGDNRSSIAQWSKFANYQPISKAKGGAKGSRKRNCHC